MAGVCAHCGSDVDRRFCGECGTKAAHVNELVLILQDIFKPLATFVSLFAGLIFARRLALSAISGRTNLRTLFWFVLSCVGINYTMYNLAGVFDAAKGVAGQDTTTLGGRAYAMGFEFGQHFGFTAVQTLMMLAPFFIVSLPLYFMMKGKASPGNFKAFVVTCGILNAALAPLDVFARLSEGYATPGYSMIMGMPVLLMTVAFVRALKALFDRSYVRTILTFFAWYSALLVLFFVIYGKQLADMNAAAAGQAEAPSVQPAPAAEPVPAPAKDDSAKAPIDSTGF